MDKAAEEKLIFRNPADSCKPASARPREMQVLTPEEIQRLLIQAKEDGCYELLLLELATGLRRGEILALRWSDLNFRTGALRVERQVHRVRGELAVSPPKTRAGNRTVLLLAPVLNVLKAYKKAIHSRWMFPSPAPPWTRPPSGSASRRCWSGRSAGGFASTICGTPSPPPLWSTGWTSSP